MELFVNMPADNTSTIASMLLQRAHLVLEGSIDTCTSCNVRSAEKNQHNGSFETTEEKYACVGKSAAKTTAPERIVEWIFSRCRMITINASVAIPQRNEKKRQRYNPVCIPAIVMKGVQRR